MARVQTIYWCIEYVDAIVSDYDTTEDIQKEFDCLELHKYNLAFTNIDNCYCVIEMEIPLHEDITQTYKNYDLVPYIKYRPVQYLCFADGTEILNSDGERYDI